MKPCRLLFLEVPPGGFHPQLPTYSAPVKRGSDEEEPGDISEYIPPCSTWSPFTSFPLAMKRPPSQESEMHMHFTTSFADPLPSKHSRAPEVESHSTGPPRMSTDALTQVSCSKGEITDALPEIVFNPALDRICKLRYPR
jgi:hypothetical protein